MLRFHLQAKILPLLEESGGRAQPSPTGRADFPARRGLQVRVYDEQGHVGLGFAAPLPERAAPRAAEDLEASLAWFQQLESPAKASQGAASAPADLLEQDPFELAQRLYRLEHPTLLALGAEGPTPSNGLFYEVAPSACFAFESALFALGAAQAGQSRAALLYQALLQLERASALSGASTSEPKPSDESDEGEEVHKAHPAQPGQPAINALLDPALTGGALLRQAKSLIKAGYPALKMKLGRRPFDQELADLFALRAAFGPKLSLRVDPNGAWSLAEAPAKLRALRPLGLEFVEQPVGAEDFPRLAEGLATSPSEGRAKGQGATGPDAEASPKHPHSPPLAADESLAHPAALSRLLAHPSLVGVFVLKPGALGGLMRSLELAQLARSQGIELVVTHSADGPIALESAHDLARALHSRAPLRLACGLAPPRH